ncbi:UNKNOWN [Stylonychia lemnae]|uniref:Uncharacterized protein n=1 Tax=Stylonychia lemnae TaxID=5949 RepID=A0A077ZU29_STYLE|nr:UNKNOWN [Stylonychia lemnae]|eukprot:CDW71961.1 UNKNOWN [Stylonychia lemnae]
MNAVILKYSCYLDNTIWNSSIISQSKKCFDLKQLPIVIGDFELDNVEIQSIDFYQSELYMAFGGTYDSKPLFGLYSFVTGYQRILWLQDYKFVNQGNFVHQQVDQVKLSNKRLVASLQSKAINELNQGSYELISLNRAGNVQGGARVESLVNKPIQKQNFEILKDGRIIVIYQGYQSDILTVIFTADFLDMSTYDNKFSSLTCQGINPGGPNQLLLYFFGHGVDHVSNTWFFFLLTESEIIANTQFQIFYVASVYNIKNVYRNLGLRQQIYFSPFGDQLTCGYFLSENGITRSGSTYLYQAHDNIASSVVTFSVSQTSITSVSHLIIIPDVDRRDKYQPFPNSTQSKIKDIAFGALVLELSQKNNSIYVCDSSKSICNIDIGTINKDQCTDWPQPFRIFIDQLEIGPKLKQSQFSYIKKDFDLNLLNDLSISINGIDDLQIGTYNITYDIHYVQQDTSWSLKKGYISIVIVKDSDYISQQFLSVNQQANQIILDGSKVKQIGVYKFKLDAKLQNAQIQLPAYHIFQVEIVNFNNQYEILNLPPFFDKKIPDIYLKSGQATKYLLPKIKDIENDIPIITILRFGFSYYFTRKVTIKFNKELFVPKAFLYILRDSLRIDATINNQKFYQIGYEILQMSGSLYQYTSSIMNILSISKFDYNYQETIQSQRRHLISYQRFLEFINDVGINQRISIYISLAINVNIYSNKHPDILQYNHRDLQLLIFLNR